MFCFENDTNMYCFDLSKAFSTLNDFLIFIDSPHKLTADSEKIAICVKPIRNCLFLSDTISICPRSISNGNVKDDCNVSINLHQEQHPL